MATLTINFNTVANAIKYRIKVRQTGTSTYAVHEVTSGPLVLNNIPCGIAYEGTVQAICSEGIPCDRYKVFTHGPADGDVHYDDCATGNSASQALTGYDNFYVCSRTAPVVQGSSGTSVTKVSPGSCVSPSPEEISGPVYWSSTAAVCPSDSYVFTSCADGTTEKYVSKVIWTSNAVYGSAPTANLVYEIDFGGNTGYSCWVYTREDDSTQHPSGLTIPLDVNQSVYDNCQQCSGTYAHKFEACDGGAVTWVLPSAWSAQSGGTPPVLNTIYRVSLGNTTACYRYTDTDNTTTAVTSQVGSTIDPYDNCQTCPDQFYALEECNGSGTQTGFYLGVQLTPGQSVRLLGDPTTCWRVMGSSTNTSGTEIVQVFNDCNSCAV